MFEGLGLMLYDGASQLGFYAADIGRFFVSLPGSLTVYDVGTYTVTLGATVGLGALVSTAGTWLTRQIDDRYQLHIADAFDAVISRAPARVQRAYALTARMVGAPMRGVQTRLHFVNYRYITSLVAPVVEEIVFRGAIQGGLQALGRALGRFGVPDSVADGLAISISSVLFAGAHNADPRTQQFRQVLISGITFGLMMHYSGLPSAMLTHSLHNLMIT